jgi:hypothetical protein
MKNSLVALMAAITVISLVSSFLVFKRYTSQRVLVVVNGQEIRKKDLDDRIDFLYTKPLLNKMIWTSLIQQEARSKHCFPTDKDVDDAVAEMDRLTPTVTASARQADRSMTLFRDMVRTNLALRNLRILGLHTKPGEVEAYYATHKAQFTQPPQAQTTCVLASDSVARDSAKAMLTEGVSTDVIAGTQGLKVVGLNAESFGQLPPAVTKQILQLQQGAIGSYPLDKGYLVIRVDKVSPQGAPPLKTIWPRVKMALLESKAPSADKVADEIRQHANIVVESDKYSSAVPKPGGPSPFSSNGNQ